MVASALDSQVAVANFALGAYLGKPTLVSIDEDTISAARCRAVYPVAVREIAEMSDWSFLREIRALSVLTNDRTTGWLYKYAYPARATRLFCLLDPIDDRTPVKDFEIAEGAIYTNVYQARARYRTLEDKPPAVWSIWFATAVAAKMAEYLTPVMTRRSADVDRFRAIATQQTLTGIENDAAQEHTPYTVDYTYANENPVNDLRDRRPDGSTIWGS